MTVVEKVFHELRFITLYKVVLTFKSVDETLVYDHSNESFFYHVVPLIMLYKVVLTLGLWMETYCVAIQMKAIEQYFHAF